MSTIYNLKVNNNAVTRIYNNNRKTNPNRKKFLRIVAGGLVVVTIVGGSLLYKNKKNNMAREQIETIIEYYGEDSIEKIILDYIAISDKLAKLDLGQYNVNKELFETYGISDVLMKPDELNLLIDDLKKNGTSDFVTIFNLVNQEPMVNQFIYKTGYSVSNKNITDATKEYTAEVFGINNPEDITLIRTYDGEGQYNVTINNKINSRNPEKYKIDNIFNKAEENQIAEGVSHMVNTNTEYDSNRDDNNIYNKTRNSYIKNALEYSVELEKKVQDNDLYNESLARKLK